MQQAHSAPGGAHQLSQQPMFTVCVKHHHFLRGGGGIVVDGAVVVVADAVGLVAIIIRLITAVV